MLELEHRFRVVDVHARLDPDRDDISARGHAVPPENLEREMHQAGIVRSVVFAGARPGESYLRANNAVARLSVDRPFVAFARINGPRTPPHRTRDRVGNLLSARRRDWHTSPDDIEQYAYDQRFHGFKLDPPRDGFPKRPVLDRLEAVSLPLIVHVGRGFPPTAAADLLLDLELPVIFAHFGGYPLNEDWMETTIDLLDDHESLYVDTSMVWDRQPIERALREYPDRVLFGTATPRVHPNVAVMNILTLDVPEDAMRRVFSKNPSRVVEALGT